MWQITLLGYGEPDEFPWEATLLPDHYPLALELAAEAGWPDTPHQTYHLTTDQVGRLLAVMGHAFPEGVREWELRVQRLYARGR